jgi:hypothetical protein
MKLNLTKCFFDVPAGKLIGFIVSVRGIKVNPEKIKAMLNISRTSCLKGIQCLTGCLAAVSWFICWLGEKAMPLSKLLKITYKFVSTYEADAALQVLNMMMSSLRILAATYSQEPMLMYMVATNRVISGVMVVGRKEEKQVYHVQRPTYYLSEVFTESKAALPPLPETGLRHFPRG